MFDRAAGRRFSLDGNAWQAAGFTSIFQFFERGGDTTLSPSVNGAAPDLVYVGQVASGRIEFDTHMNGIPPSQILEAKLSRWEGRVFDEMGSEA